ncbi:MAG: tetratricopeptide repeat protein [Magnetococcales bacterium]|nr:tetratricopeptide repeat protein [Magnetococcales bacterium]
MSVMYRALRKLKKTDATAGIGGRGGVAVGRAIDDLGDGMSATARVALGALPLVVLGLGAGYWYMQQGGVEGLDIAGEGQKMPSVAVQDAVKASPASAASAAASALSPIMPISTAQAQSPSASVLPSSPIPASPSAGQAAVSAASAGAAKGSVASQAVDDAASTARATAATQAEAARLERLLNGLAGGEQPPKSGAAQIADAGSSGAKSADSPAEAASEASASSGGKRTTSRGGSSSGGNANAKKGKGEAVAGSPAGTGDYPQGDDAAEAVRKKTMAMAQAAATARKALASGDAQQADASLSKLATMKGGHNAYVMKMQAYVYMREGKYAQAGSLLEEVLKTRRDDLDAAKNMVIVEMKTNRGDLAQERLKDLLRRFPNDRQLRDLRQYLN